MNYFLFAFPLRYSNERDTWFFQLNQIVINDCKVWYLISLFFVLNRNKILKSNKQFNITIWFNQQIYAFLPLRIDKMKVQTWNNWFIICSLIWGCHTSVHGGHLPPEKRLFELHLFLDTGAGDWISHEIRTLEVIKDQNELFCLTKQQIKI